MVNNDNHPGNRLMNYSWRRVFDGLAIALLLFVIASQAQGAIAGSARILSVVLSVVSALCCVGVFKDIAKVRALTGYMLIVLAAIIALAAWRFRIPLLLAGIICCAFAIVGIGLTVQTRKRGRITSLWAARLGCAVRVACAGSNPQETWNCGAKTMTKVDLEVRFQDEHIRTDAYSLTGGHPSEKYVLSQESDENWAVYYSERGQRVSEVRFDSENQACEYMLKIILEDTTTRS